MPSLAFERNYYAISYGTIYYQIVSHTARSNRFLADRIICVAARGPRRPNRNNALDNINLRYRAEFIGRR
jgi:hypothetical protein